MSMGASHSITRDGAPRLFPHGGGLAFRGERAVHFERVPGDPDRDQNRPATPRRSRASSPAAVHAAHARLPAGARAQQPARVVPRAEGPLRRGRARADGGAGGAAGGRPRGVRARPRRQPAHVDVPALPRHAVLGRTRRRSRRTSRPCSRTARCRSTKGRASTWRSRRVMSGSGEACTCPRAPCSTRCASTLPRSTAPVADRRFGRLQADVRHARGRATAARAHEGFAPDHPAGAFLKYSQFLAGVRAPGRVRHERPASTGRCSPRSRRWRRSCSS